MDEMDTRTTTKPKHVVFVLGGPGSGKGTHCERIASELGYAHLSTGDLLREEQKNGSELAAKIDECIRAGTLVPSSTMVELLKAAIMADGGGPEDKPSMFLIDGFPRSMENLEAWFEAFSDDQVQVVFTLFLDCPKEALKKRLLERGKTSGRADDNIESVLKRFDTFEKESLPVVDYLEKLGVVRRVCSVPPREVVFHQVRRIFAGSRLVPPTERTLALIKPDAVAAGKAGDITHRIKEEGFVVVGRIDDQIWSREKAAEFYEEHQERPFFETLVGFMSSGPVVQLCLEKVDAVRAWRRLAGPTNSTKAKESDPASIRALFGSDGTQNAVHDAVLNILAFRKFQVLKTLTQVMSEKDVRGFFNDETKADPQFGELTKLMVEGGSTTALCLSRVAAVDAWQSLMGPSDPSEARDRWPDCLRALFGTDRIRNATHGSCSAEDAARETSYWFPECSLEQSSPRSPLIGAKAVAAGDPRYDEMMSFIKEKVDPVMHPLLQRVLKARPVDIAAFVVQDLGSSSQEQQQQQTLQQPQQEAA